MNASDSLDEQLRLFLVSLQEMKNELRESRLRTDAQFAKTDAQIAKTDAQLAKTDAQLAKTDAKLKETAMILSNIGINLGNTAEEYFFNGLVEKPVLGDITFDEVKANIHGRNKKAEDEFDLVLYNGNTIGIVEVKHKVHPKDIEKLQTQKVENFRLLFPDYADYAIYLGIAGMSIPPEVEELAIRKGIAVLRQKGQIIVKNDKNLVAY